MSWLWKCEQRRLHDRLPILVVNIRKCSVSTVHASAEYVQQLLNSNLYPLVAELKEGSEIMGVLWGVMGGYSRTCGISRPGRFRFHHPPQKKKKKNTTCLRMKRKRHHKAGALEANIMSA